MSTEVYVFPPSFAQERLWFLNELEPGSPFYNIPQAIRITGPLKTRVVKEALNEIVRRHETLRTTFSVRDHSPVQMIAANRSVALPVIDLGALVGSSRAAEVRRLSLAEAQTPFDLTTGPLLRSTLLRLSESRHDLLITIHHIVSDGWSLGVFGHELTLLYEAFEKSLPSPLKDLPIQYADYAVWQREWLQGEVLETQLKYWKERLRDAPPALELPTDRSRPAVQSFKGTFKSWDLAAKMRRALEELGGRKGATLFMTLLAAFQILLGRYSGQDDVVVGSPIAGRTRGEIEPLIGFFVNTLALRTDLSGNPTFLELLQRLRDNTLEAFANQDVPFEKVVDELQPKRNPSYSPVFQVMFVLQNAPQQQLKLGALRLDEVFVDSGTSKFDLTLFVFLKSEGLTLNLQYNTDLFDDSTIDRMIEHYLVLLDAIIANPAERICQLPIMSKAERKRLLIDWNDTAEDYPRHKRMHELFEEQVAQTPNAVAVTCNAEELTYLELDRSANRLAAYLQRQGVGPEILVGLCVERSLEMVIGLLGILKAGGCYVPLDPGYPRQRLRFILEDARISVLVTQTHLLGALPATSAQIISMDSEAAHIERESLSKPETIGATTNLAYLIYTSGSTGKPKGVAIEHRSATALLSWARRVYFDEELAGVLASTSICFDLSVFELFLPLSFGGRVIIAQDALQLPGLQNASEVTLINTVPSAMAELLRLGEIPRSVQTVNLAGEPLSTTLVQQIYQRPHIKRVFDLYGPSEDTTYSTYALRIANGPATIGRPISNSKIYILDPNLEPVPTGVAGELCIGGEGLARGYFDRPSLTAEKFIPDPFSSEQGARLYKTGDRARYRSDGNIDYLGRMDYQIKLRGYRIELGEIEAAINEYPRVRESVVLIREDEPDDKRLVAYVVPSEVATPKQDTDQDHRPEKLSQWEAVWDEIYAQGAAPAEPEFNIVGWNSSYTGDPIPQEQMRCWIDSTVERILNLCPGRVLEIGCGTGLLLFRIAPHCSHYHGTDISKAAIDYLQSHLAGTVPAFRNVAVSHQGAEAFEAFEPGVFDVVILNSVIQYFPSLAYLLEVLGGAVKAVRPGGAVFVGDVRNLRLLEAFHASVQLYDVPPSMALADVRQRVQQKLKQEKELVIDPDFFSLLKRYLPNVSRVEIQLKRSVHQNELTQFRYDVILHVAQEKLREITPNWLNWKEEVQSLQTLQQLISSTSPEILAISNVPNARVVASHRAQTLLSEDGLATVDDLRNVLQSHSVIAVDPEEFWQLGEKFGYVADVTWSASGASENFDVILRRENGRPIDLTRSEPEVAVEWQKYANNPLRSENERSLEPELRRFLAERLPEQMIPSHFVLLDALPRTANGKLDRGVLPPPNQSRPDIEQTFVAPRSSTETMVASVWIDVLKVKEVGVHDNFFALGGHSLLATQVISRLRDLYEMQLPLRRLFQSPTVAELAEQIDRFRETAEFDQPPLGRVSRNGKLPLSFAQQRLWFLCELQPESSFYNVSTALRIRGILNVAALERSLNTIVERHEALRTVFDTVDDQPVQIILEEKLGNLVLVDLVDLPGAAEEAQKLLTSEAHRSFDLARGPLFRPVLVAVADNDYMLLLNTHHIVSDGWSTAILFRELRTLYNSYCRNQISPLKELELQYADYSVWQRTWLQDERLEKRLSYWRRHLAGAPLVLELPSEKARPAVQTFRGADFSSKLTDKLSKEIKDLSQREAVTPFMTFMAAFQLLLSRLTGNKDIIVGTDLANRDRVEFEQIIGFFVNLLPIRIDLSGNPTFRELLARVRHTMLEAHAHQEVPFEKLVEELRPQRDLRRNPLVQVLLVMQNTEQRDLHLTGLDLESIELGHPNSRFDLALFMSEAENQFLGRWRYNPDLFEASTISIMSGHFERLLRAMVEDVSARLDSYQIFTDNEARQKKLEKNEKQRSQTDRLKATRRHGVDLAQVSGVKIEYFRPDSKLPLVIKPEAAEVDLVEWTDANRGDIESRLLEHGAILFREFNVESIPTFERFASTIWPDLFGEYGDLPREEVGGKVYGSTPYPADETILFHNESSHMHRWPMLIWFYCVKAATQGGESPIVDCRQVYRLMDPAIREEFERKGLMYVRNFTKELDVSWQSFFHTPDKTAVEKYCRSAGIEFEWKGENDLRTSQVCPAVVKHPQTGEMVFFNQLQLHHISCLAPAVRESLLSMMAEEDLPRNVYYGDGTRIEDSVMQYVGELYQQQAVEFGWIEHDILMLNNMMVAHSRNPYVGERRIVVALGNITNKSEVESASF